MIPVLACGYALSSIDWFVVFAIVFAPSWISGVILFGSAIVRMVKHKPVSIRCLMVWTAIVGAAVSGQLAILTQTGF